VNGTTGFLSSNALYEKFSYIKTTLMLEPVALFFLIYACVIKVSPIPISYVGPEFEGFLEISTA